MLRCVLGNCPNEVAGGFKHEVAAPHLNAPAAKIESGSSAAFSMHSAVGFQGLCRSLRFSGLFALQLTTPAVVNSD